jgi:hypothetical protein
MLIGTSKTRRKQPNCGYLRQQVPEWPLNRSQKNAPKGWEDYGFPGIITSYRLFEFDQIVWFDVHIM